MSANSKTEKTRPAFINPASKLWEEDGWIFRERPGVPVEIVRRAAEKPAEEMTPPNQNRHNYPSA